MQKLLVSLVIDTNDSNKVAATVLDVPDTYAAINDSPDDANPFPKLREWIYEGVRSRADITAEHGDAYKPDNTFITGITVLGNTDKSESVLGAAEKIMGNI